MSTEMIINIVLSILGALGFLLAGYIHYKKTRKTPLICPLRSNCNKVIESQYSEILGIPVEILGMAYYAFVIASHVGILLVPGVVDPFVMAVGILLSFGAFCFSVYLICVQAFLIKEWCTWCITSATISLLIFILTLLFVPQEVRDFLLVSKKAVSVLHLIGAGIGLGAATISDIFFFKFLKDGKISFFESDVLKTLSIVIWGALALVLFSGIGLYLPQNEILHQSPKFITKMIAVFVLVVNGLVLNFIITPKLTRAFFHLYTSFQRLAFAGGAISITSWYFVFILGALRKITITLPVLLSLYIAITIVAVIGSQIFLYSLSKKD